MGERADALDCFERVATKSARSSPSGAMSTPASRPPGKGRPLNPVRGVRVISVSTRSASLGTDDLNVATSVGMAAAVKNPSVSPSRSSSVREEGGELDIHRHKRLHRGLGDKQANVHDRNLHGPSKQTATRARFTGPRELSERYSHVVTALIQASSTSRATVCGISVASGGMR